MNKISGLIRLMRPINCAMMGFAVFVGAVLANPQFFSFDWLGILYGFVTGFTLTAASMSINDYYDRSIDAINEPSRPIPSGLVSAREALAFVFVLSAIGFVFAFITNILCLLVAIFSWIVVVTYVTVGKRSGLPGNFLVSTCVAIPFIYGSIASVNQVRLSVLLFALMAFLSNTGREITKGIVDVKGDKAEGVKTLAVRYGKKNAAVVASLFYVSAVSLTPLPWVLSLVSFWFFPIVLVTDIGLVASSALLINDSSRESARRIKKMVLLWLLIGLVAYVFGVFK
ncbi:MAG: geranylgeranylglycerol-phosphate geranylgeranyltransferase [Candidatus Bathyarchaeota archaeon]|nr:MAG: geranylgeranylglycerol-phosphate geranylgeranyltransferase [Candidatus Bathyarchaeota archaeon]